MRLSFLVVAAVLAGAAPAAAGDAASGSTSSEASSPGGDDLIGLIDVRAEGVSETAAAAFASQIETAVGIAGFKVATPARLREFLTTSPWNAACLVGACLGILKTHAGVDRVVEARIVSSGPSYHYVLTVLDTGTGGVLAQKSDRCEVCTMEEAFAEAHLELVGLLSGLAGDPSVREVPPPAAPPGRRAKRVTRRLGLSLVGAAALVGLGSALFYARDDDGLGGIAAGAAGAFAVAGVTSLGISVAF